MMRVFGIFRAACHAYATIIFLIICSKLNTMRYFRAAQPLSLRLPYADLTHAGRDALKPPILLSLTPRHAIYYVAHTPMLIGTSPAAI